MAMVKLSPLWHRTFNIFGTLCLFIGIQLSRFGVTVTAVPAGVGLGIVLISFVSVIFWLSIYTCTTFQLHVQNYT